MSKPIRVEVPVCEVENRPPGAVVEILLEALQRAHVPVQRLYHPREGVVMAIEHGKLSREDSRVRGSIVFTWQP